RRDDGRRQYKTVPAPEQAVTDLSNQDRGSDQSNGPLPVVLPLVLRALDRNQHDDENKEHQDSADIHDDLNAGKKLRMKRQEDSRNREQRSAKERRAMDNIALRDH